MNPATTETTATIDNALSELVQLRWSWEHEERTAEKKKQIWERVERLAAQVSGAHADFARSIRESMSSARPMMGAFRAARQAPPTPEMEAAKPFSSIESLLSGLPVDWEKVQESDLPQLIARASGAAASTAESFQSEAPVSLPARNATSTPAAHVQLFTQAGGLIHGGIVSIGRSRLVCRAFSYFKHTSNRALFGPGQSQRVHVVAGVCEQFDPAGKVVQRWSTAERLPEIYQNTSQSLPDSAWRSTGLLATGEGFYEASFGPDVTRQLVKNLQSGTPVPVPDSGTPNATLYGKEQFFAISPGRDAALENALYQSTASGTEGWVINTPYLSVFSPSPQLSTVIVAMVGAYREASWTTRGSMFKGLSSHMDRFARKAGWAVRSFHLPLSD